MRNILKSIMFLLIWLTVILVVIGKVSILTTYFELSDEMFYLYLETLLGSIIITIVSIVLYDYIIYLNFKRKIRNIFRELKLIFRFRISENYSCYDDILLEDIRELILAAKVEVGRMEPRKYDFNSSVSANLQNDLVSIKNNIDRFEGMYKRVKKSSS